MILYPAIDIFDGNAVRLTKGEFDARKVYDEDPLAAARRWVAAGAERLHVVDLDGAREGRPVNLEHVRAIAAALDVPVQLGGGLRSAAAIDAALGAGVQRVIVGTAAVNDPDLLARALEQHGPERVVVSVDIREGRVTTEGWTKPSDVSTREVFADLIARGVKELAYTDVDRDGMLSGVGREDVVWAARAVGESAHLIYSGGIGQIDDLRALAALGEPSLTGVIVGKALYEGRFTVAEAKAALTV
ncbi:MAG TPA: 1-(5-phosphoribosyl)-5-[(5-phosphoribosylamino)methylideneamino]imidazole-4-carboxamide isomerase [Solirubrobacteraceae bacterium]|jgi:phosphoribosylformimino-5-aminoimidazole carboxamide ribotide isomerase|nr:1-(5-phosphoribosyl)-5-[(5-phosphoribosylamino)methylideneamino]imidazole-4-carboxamide isomerase [Solirubrobacteraceae bacterium]